MTDILVAGIGNLFLGDDGFGVEVVRRFGKVPGGVRAVDFGVRGVHLAYELLEPPDLLVLVDAARRGGAPGTIYVIDPSTDPSWTRAVTCDAHGMSIDGIFAMVRELGGAIPKTRIVACEPLAIEERIGLSPVVDRAVQAAIEILHRLIDKEGAPA